MYVSRGSADVEGGGGRGVRCEFGGSATVVLCRITATLVPSGTSAVSRKEGYVWRGGPWTSQGITKTRPLEVTTKSITYTSS
jgi:hypothetical protein